MKKYFDYLLLILLPILLLLTAFFLQKARGPFWFGSNSDPDYAYLLNSVNLARLKGVGLVGHPGTPVHVIGAVVLRASHFLFFSNLGDLQTVVLKNPELFLSIINNVMVGLNVSLLLLMGIIIYLFTENIFLSFFIQLSPFFSTVILSSLKRASPEPLLLFISLLFVLIVTIVINSDFDKHHRRFAIVFAIISGLGVATKATFIPIIIIPLFILPRSKYKLYIFGIIASFVFFTIPIIMQYPRMLYWFLRIFIHTGIYGSGKLGIIEPGLYLSNLNTLISSNSVFFYTLLFSVLFILINIFIPRLCKLAIKDIRFKLLSGIVVSQIIGIFMVAKHFSSHYLFPVLCLSVMTLVLMFLYFKEINVKLKINIKWEYVLIIAILIFRYSKVMKISDLPPYNKSKSFAIYQKVEKEFKDYVKIYYYRSSSPLYALKMGDDFANRENSKKLQQLYSNIYFYDIWERNFYNWGEQIDFEEIILLHGEDILFQGTPFDKYYKNNPEYKPDLLLIDILGGKKETLYKYKGRIEDPKI